MNAEERRENILKLLAESDSPLSGTDLAKCLAVSRQVIVQDIALLCAVNKNILSTNKGYLLFHEEETRSDIRSSRFWMNCIRSLIWAGIFSMW